MYYRYGRRRVQKLAIVIHYKSTLITVLSSPEDVINHFQSFETLNSFFGEFWSIFEGLIKFKLDFEDLTKFS